MFLTMFEKNQNWEEKKLYNVHIVHWTAFAILAMSNQVLLGCYSGWCFLTGFILYQNLIFFAAGAKPNYFL